jgi:transketolase
MEHKGFTDIRTVEKGRAREGFGLGVLDAARANKNVMALCADLTESIMLAKLREELPKQFVEVGVAEQNMMGIAAGLALSGKIPFVASYAVFNPGRNWDQLRVSVCYSNANVKVVGAHAGISVGPDGATHQALEDIAITRVLPNLLVIAPTDIHETRAAVAALVAHNGPCYIRFGRDVVPTLTKPDMPFEIGKAYALRHGSHCTVVANGPLVAEALLAAEELAGEGIELEVIASPSIKPLDSHTILASAKKTGCVVVAEEAQIIGGLGSAVAELIGEAAPMPVIRVGIHDSFGESGTPDELMDRYGLRSRHIIAAARKALSLNR